MLSNPISQTSTIFNDISWKPPLDEFITCNIDAALFEETKTFGIGFCLRDKHDNFIKAKTATINCFPSPMEAEAWALLSVILWPQNLQLKYVIIESDCKVVTDHFNSCSKGISEFHVIMDKCRH